MISANLYASVWGIYYFQFNFCVVLQIRYSISEEVNEGTVVGNIAKDLGIDKNELKARGYRIIDSSIEPLFRFNEDNGFLYVRRNVDREEICERSSACVINLKTVLQKPLEIHYVGIEVLDVNDHSPSFSEREKRLEIFESALPGARFQLQPARDADGLQFSIQQYKLSQNDLFRLEVEERGEDRKTPFLVLQKKLDRETVGKHKLLLTAIDGGRPAKSGTIELLIEVLDVNDNSPVFTQDAYRVTLNENVPPGTVVVQINATDLDEGANGEIVYSFGKEVDVSLKKLFSIDSQTGEIKVIGEIDYEQTKNFEIDVRATDKGPVPLFVDKIVTIKVVDLNDNIPKIEVTSFSESVPEDCKIETTVGLISVSDLDSGSNGKVSCFIPDDAPFSIYPSLQNNMYAIVTTSPLDRETKSLYALTVIAKDAGVPSLSSQKTITVVVSDVNDNKPEFPVGPQTFYIIENNKIDAPLFSVRATDNDEGDNARILYNLEKNKDKGIVLFLNIDSETGAISTLKSFDFESVETFQFHVVATDSGSPPLSSNVTVNVFILDQNDNAPVILYPVSSNGSAEGVEEIPRNVNAGHLVTKIRAYDADIGYNGWLLFSLQQVTDHTSFLSINSESGEVVALKSFDFESVKTFQFHVVATDSGSPPLSSNVTVNVFILDQNDNAPVILYPVSSNGSAEGVEEIPRNVNAGHLVTKVRAYDADIGYNGWLLFSLQQVTDHSLFALDRYTGQIRTLRSFTETDEAEHKLLILVKDNGNVSLSATATVIVKLVEPKEAFAASDVQSAAAEDEDSHVTFYLIITLGSVSLLFLISIIVLIAMQCSKSTDYTSKYLPEPNYDGTLCHSIQYRSGDKRYMLVGPRMSVGSTIVPGSHANTLVLPDRRKTCEEVRNVSYFK
uniref:Protocadherin 2 alpha a 15 n=1 Tax=Oryzias latipes TaxID=8090 RepID=A0A3P9JRD1_ORYLA